MSWWVFTIGEENLFITKMVRKTLVYKTYPTFTYSVKKNPDIHELLL